ncbi:hypothetical protein NN6n1_05740 [Shinella zoogloeoides]
MSTAAGMDAPTFAGTVAPARSGTIVLTIMLAGALLLWTRSLGMSDPDGMTDLGLVSIVPSIFHLSLALLAAGFSWLMIRGRTGGPLPLLYLAALILVLAATPPIVYGTLRYSWAWKHLGIVDYIQRHGSVDRTAPFLAAYHNWPGLFAATAWIADRFGVKAADLAPILRFTPPALDLAVCAAYLQLIRRLTDDPRLPLTAAWLFVTANWIGQDYFSPQGFSFLFYIILLGLFLGPLRRTTAPSPSGGFSGVLASAAAMVLIVAIVVTHQLTPLLVILSIGVLTLGRRLSPAYLFFVLIAQLLWLLWGAAPFVLEQIHDELAAIGTLSEATSKMANVGTVSAERGQAIVVGRALTATIGLVAIAGGFRRLWNGFRDYTAVALLLAPAPLLLVAYGGEAVFRAYMFASPFLAFFAAAIFFPSPAAGRTILSFPLLFLLCLFSAIGFLFANNGKDREYRFTRDEVATARWLYSIAPPGTLLVEGARSYPSQFMNYENFAYLPISEEDHAARQEIVTDPAGVFYRWMADPRWNDTFLILTRSQKAYLQASGMQPGDFNRMENILLSSPRFHLVRASPNARIFRLQAARPRAGGYLPSRR